MELLFRRWGREGISRTRGTVSKARAVTQMIGFQSVASGDQFVDGMDESACGRGESISIRRTGKPVARKA